VRHLHAPQQVGVFPVQGVGHGRAGARIDRAKSHLPHQGADEFPSRPDSVGFPQFCLYLALARSRVVRKDFVHEVHDLDLALGHYRRVVDSAAGDSQQVALLRDGVFLILALHEVSP